MPSSPFAPVLEGEDRYTAAAADGPSLSNPRIAGGQSGVSMCTSRAKLSRTVGDENLSVLTTDRMAGASDRPMRQIPAEILAAAEQGFDIVETWPLPLVRSAEARAVSQ
jgi:hypothetical protein